MDLPTWGWRPRLFRLCPFGASLGESHPLGYRVVLDNGKLVGHLELFDEPLPDAVNAAVALVRAPWSLACLLEAAGPLALVRCSAILARQVSEAE
jgi:hypothetical protein